MPPIQPADGLARCEWCLNDPLNIAYHDSVWCVPCHDDDQLFEHLCLEIMEAGLSWILILRKRDAFRSAFAHFKIDAVAAFPPEQVDVIMQHENIVRARNKIEAILHNAQRVQALQAEFGSFSAYVWQWVEGKPIQNALLDYDSIPDSTALSERISKDLKKRGFKFTGPSVVYSFLQSAGVVNDHLVHCFRYEQV